MSVHLRGIKPALSPDADALTKAPPPPRHLDAFARDEWKRIMPQLIARKIITRADLGGIEDLCLMRGLVRQIEVTRADAGGQIDGKLFGVQHRAAMAARMLAAEYGLSPTSRSRLGTAAPEDDDDTDPLAV